MTPARTGKGAPKLQAPSCEPAKPPLPRYVVMSWARRLKRVFGIEIDTCAHCGGTLKINARIEEPPVIARILAHLERTAPEQYPAELSPGSADRRTCRSRPALGRFGPTLRFTMRTGSGKGGGLKVLSASRIESKIALIDGAALAKHMIDHSMQRTAPLAKSNTLDEVR